MSRTTTDPEREDETAGSVGSTSNVVAMFDDFVSRVAPQIPLPGRGATWERFTTLAQWSAQDLSVGRLCEGHSDAIAILCEAGMKPQAECSYGVWAARSATGPTYATKVAGGWQLSGAKAFCSGSRLIERALVTAESESGYLLFDISTKDQVVGVQPGSWPTVGMAASQSETLEFGGPPVPEDRVVGPADFYLQRPGFWFGAVGVAACWYGGARGVVEDLTQGLKPEMSDVTLASLGEAVATLEVMRVVLSYAAAQIDGDPLNQSGQAKFLALVARRAVHDGAQAVLSAAASAGGARPFTLDERQSRRAADLFIYLTQHHGASDAVELGRLAG
ncbi:MAG TPA: hypothetical protein VGG21_04735, partial [Acidimicrobiales bacterium]